MIDIETVTSKMEQLAGFRMSDAEMQQLDLRRHVIIAQDNMGHVTLENYDTEEAYRARMDEVSEPNGVTAPSAISNGASVPTPRAGVGASLNGLCNNCTMGAEMLDPNEAQPVAPQFAATLAPGHMVEIYRLDAAGQVAPQPYRSFADCPDDSIALTDCRLLPLASGGWALVGKERPLCGAGPRRTVVPWPALDQVCWPDVHYAAPHPDGVHIIYHPQAAVR